MQTPPTRRREQDHTDQKHIYLSRYPLKYLLVGHPRGDITSSDLFDVYSCGRYAGQKRTTTQAIAANVSRLTWRNRQLMPLISSRLYPVISTKSSLTKTVAQQQQKQTKILHSAVVSMVELLIFPNSGRQQNRIPIRRGKI